MDALLLAHDRDGDAALRSCRAAALLGEAFHDDPLVICHLIRMQARLTACDAIDRTLAQTEASESALAETQALVQRLEPLPLCRAALRGERAITHRLIKLVEDGGTTFAALATDRGGEPESLGGIVFRRYRLPADHVAFLDMMDQCLQAAALPVELANDRLNAIGMAYREPPFVFAKIAAPVVIKAGYSDVRCCAELRIHAMLLAAERFRLKNGKLPESVGALVPAFLARPYDDPYDGAPLRVVREADRLLIYSVGPDRIDDGGNLAKHQLPDGTDLGCSLWDVPKRRQPAPPPKPDEP